MLAIGIFIAARAHAAARRGACAGRTAFARGRRFRGEKSGLVAMEIRNGDIALRACICHRTSQADYNSTTEAWARRTEPHSHPCSPARWSSFPSIRGRIN